MPPLAGGLAEAEEELAGGDLLEKDGPENPYDIKKELRRVVDQHLGVYREEEQMTAGLAKLKSLQERFENIHVRDRGRVYNTNLTNVLEIENMLTLAEVLFTAAIARKESRGGHSRKDFLDRDDANWLRHTLVTTSPEGPRLDYKPVTITKWKPVERKY